MSSNGRNWLVLSLAIVVSATYSALYLAASAVSEAHTGVLLRLTARLALALFLLILVARSLQQLRPSSIGRSLLRNRRYIGIALAGVMTVHLALIVLHWGFILERSIPVKILLFGGGAYVMMYLMLITSFDRPAAVIGRGNWRRLHKTGLYWLGFVFIYTLVPESLEALQDPAYPALIMLTLLAVGIRVAAFAGKRQRPSR